MVGAVGALGYAVALEIDGVVGTLGFAVALAIDGATGAAGSETRTLRCG
jgi:hypothetical protein